MNSKTTITASSADHAKWALDRLQEHAQAFRWHYDGILMRTNGANIEITGPYDDIASLVANTNIKKDAFDWDRECAEMQKRFQDC